MNTHKICLYKEVDKNYTGCNLKTTKLLDCALVGVCAVIRSNMAVWKNMFDCHYYYRKTYFYNRKFTKSKENVMGVSTFNGQKSTGNRCHLLCFRKCCFQGSDVTLHLTSLFFTFSLTIMHVTQTCWVKISANILKYFLIFSRSNLHEMSYAIF